MLKKIHKSECCGCHACVQVCPKGCISMNSDEEGFLYPTIDESVCVHCGLCETVCPVLHPPVISQDAPTPPAYAAYNNDEQVRLESSSGGVFTPIAEWILSKNGVVYGAAMTSEASVAHIRCADVQALSSLRGSKYIQSDIRKTYLQAKEDLDRGTPVLFTGTPCQIAGLHTFLRKSYDHLYCMDFVCHGVPSQMVWQKYLAYQENRLGASMSQVYFRHKIKGWKAFSLSIDTNGSLQYSKTHMEDLFMQVFLKNLCLRPSCYQCRFKSIHRISDVTVADLWGIESICPEMDDDKGASMVIVHSKKGAMLLSEISDAVTTRAIDLNAAVKHNSAMVSSSPRPKHRDAFMQSVLTKPFDRVARKYVLGGIKGAIKRMIKRILRALGLFDWAKRLKNKLIS